VIFQERDFQSCVLFVFSLFFKAMLENSKRFGSGIVVNVIDMREKSKNILYKKVKKFVL
jgi:hypothetical protein